MRKENIIQKKSFAFAVRIVKLYQHMSQKEKEYVLSKQLLRSGTSIGANVEESIGGSSKKDFKAKLKISYKEARETMYWLKLLKETNYINETEFKSISEDCDEILRLLFTITRNTKLDN